VRVTATGPDGEPLGAWETTESGEHKRLDDLISETGVDEPPVKPSTAITRYVDRAMFEAERFEEAERERPRVHLLSATPDPLGAVAAFSMMYEGQTVTDLARSPTMSAATTGPRRSRRRSSRRWRPSTSTLW
jgi:hypothetical protein